MSKDLIESIIDDNLVAAKDIFTERMNHILECKLYEEKRRISADMSEAMLGMGLSKKEMKKREEAGYVPAHKALGLSPYDIGKEEKEKRLAARAKEYKDKKKVGKKNLEEMRAPGEVPGSESRKSDAEKLRAFRALDKTLGSDKGNLTKGYLTARRAQVGSGAKTNVTDVPASSGTVNQEKSQTRSQKTLSAERPAMDMSKMRREKPGIDMSKMSRAASERTGPIRKVSIPKSDRMERIKQSAERLKARGHSDPLGKLTALKTKRFLRTLGTGLRAVKRGAEEIGRTGGSI